MAFGKESSTNASKKRYRFEIVSSTGQRIVHNYVGESAEKVEKMLIDNIYNARSIRFVGVVYLYQRVVEKAEK